MPIKDYKSLHAKGTKSMYADLIRKLCCVLLPFSRNMVDLIGFSASIPPKPNVCYRFPMTLNPSIPRVSSIEQAVSTYGSCSQTVTFSGPRRLVPLLKRCRTV
ncbi:hypothetical protein ADUPG1_000976 [Aduncisulcus paluster]|uniref:Copine C-terminal domain-containing protein n=1 Tax=Aduncisulcus paluster TaxID=2918883 RepID=A0ABQ5K8T5_9EUKA|nr:hypothetical protein ADUPG1_000976 [Aduncisulcus paluster]